MKNKRRLFLILATCLLLESNMETFAALHKTMYVSAESGLNVREYPDVDSDKLSALPFNAKVDVKEVKENWALVSYNDKDAYVCAAYLSETEQKKKTVTGAYLGTFTASHYCPCSVCCGWSTGITASGTYAAPGRTVGVDTSVIPLGAHLLIDGKEYVAEDTGNGVDGNWVDIFVNSHQEALDLGLKTVEVFIID